MKISGPNIARLVIIGLLWLALCAMLILRGGLNAWNVFVIAASGIVIFVPLLKKYGKEEKK
ncbi:MAG: hypothetical protein J5784_04460 [Muribaculaceae bacterium]|nr:hypothetical protein [Muribaculaceae bacterium]MBR5745321.1 hypothetical protein [Muribaculaceae bacterium]